MDSGCSDWCSSDAWVGMREGEGRCSSQAEKKHAASDRLPVCCFFVYVVVCSASRVSDVCVCVLAFAKAACGCTRTLRALQQVYRGVDSPSLHMCLCVSRPPPSLPSPTPPVPLEGGGVWHFLVTIAFIVCACECVCMWYTYWMCSHSTPPLSPHVVPRWLIRFFLVVVILPPLVPSFLLVCVPHLRACFDCACGRMYVCVGVGVSAEDRVGNNARLR